MTEIPQNMYRHFGTLYGAYRTSLGFGDLYMNEHDEYPAMKFRWEVRTRGTVHVVEWVVTLLVLLQHMDSLTMYAEEYAQYAKKQMGEKM